MPAEQSTSIAKGHIPALDGIRGLAITMVVLLHFLTSAVPKNAIEQLLLMAAGKGAAFLDLFFVLSGFLITGILLDSKSKEKFFSRFFIRRTLRIFPLFYATLILITVFVYWFPEIAGVEGQRFKEASPWAWTYLYNFFLATKGEWYITSVDHFWSLAVEEQFYFVWPFVIYFLSRHAIARVCAWAVFGAAVLYVLMQHLGFSHVTLHVFTPLRLSSLCSGAALALVLRDPKVVEKGKPFAYAKANLFFFGSVAAKLILVLIGKLWPHVSADLEILRTLTWISLFVSLHLYAVSQDQKNPVKYLLTRSSLIFMGKYSYGIYLFHCFLITPIHRLDLFSRATQFTGNSTVGMLLVTAAATGLSVCIAWLSYHLFEKHFLKLKDTLAPAKQ